MNYCPECGNKILEYYKFCSKCGIKLNTNKSIDYKKCMERHYNILNEIRFNLYSQAINEDNIFNEYSEKCIKLCIEDLSIAPYVNEWWKNDCEIYNREYVPLNYGSNKYLLKLLEKQKRYEEALIYCNQYIELGLTDDGTKGGIIARKERIKKLLNKGV